MKSWRSAMAMLVAIVFAIIVPSALVVGGYFLSGTSPPDVDGWLRLRNFSILVVPFVSAHVVLLGLPVFLVMHASRAITWLKSVVAGLGLGAFPIGIFTLPFVHSAVDSTGYYLVAGKAVYATTADGWLEWIGVMGFMGALGALGGLTFWLAWRGSLHLFERSMPRP